MKYTIAAALAVMSVASAAQSQNSSAGYPITPVPFTQVKVEQNSFWGQRLEASRNVTIPLAFSKCEETGRYTNFSNAHEHLVDPSKVFPICEEGMPFTYSFDDTDPYKTIEGASYLLQTYPDKKLEAYVDSVIGVIASGQEPDGYLYTARTQNPQHPHPWAGDTRWSKVEDLSHEFYNLGHLCEAAVAHYYATGKRNFLDVAIKYADCVCREVGDKEGQACVVPGHQIAEMGLCKLYLATGDKKYLEQAKFFLDKRGYTTIQTEYSQSHEPVLKQKEAVGHAVRAGYMYAGMADVAALTGDKDYIAAIDAIWDNIVSKKYYITGGVGSTSNGEAFGENYELPNMSAYCETCAAIAQVYLNYRLFLLHGESKYYDALERSLYNGVISGISIDGGAFFYPNPLESIGQHQRQPWFGCACCPSNAARFIPSIPGYTYQVKDNDVYVNLFMSNTSEIALGKKKITLEQKTSYPWNGDITATVKKSNAGQFALKIRIPGWVRGKVVPSDLYTYDDGVRLGYSIKVNGQEVSSQLDNGYFTIDRKWKAGDKVEIHFDMQPRIVRANNNVMSDRGRVAVECGPIVYCAEWADNDFDVLGVLMNQSPKFEVSAITSDILKTYNMVTTNAQTLEFDKEGKLVAKDVKLKMIPYYAWNHRGPGAMAVWMAKDLSASRPTMPATLASQSKIDASQMERSISAINDRLVPKNEFDRSMPYYHWWPKQGTTEWISYTFAEPSEVKSATVYWFDDAPWGGCRVPESWKIYYMDGEGQWQPVSNADSYGTAKGCGNTVNFDPVTTKAVKLEVVQPEKYSSGLFEWEIK